MLEVRCQMVANKKMTIAALLVVLGVSLSIASGWISPAELTAGCSSYNGSGIPYTGADVLVQAWNYFPKFHFVPHASFQAVADIRMGASYSNTILDQPNLGVFLDNIIEFGIWRFDTCVDECEPPINWGFNNEEEFPEEYDQFIDGLNANGITVNYMLHFWDKTGHLYGEELSTPRFQTEEQIQDFLNYTRVVVSQHRGLFQYYTIWTEPDACPGIKCIEPEDYINLVRRTVPVIHEEDPLAMVAIAPNVLFYAQEYLAAILESDIMTMVDVVQWHGLYNYMPIDPLHGDYYNQYPAIIEGIRQTAAAHGFDGQYWATEITYCSEEFPFCTPPDMLDLIPETDKQAAKYNARTIVMHLGMDMGISMGTLRYDNPRIAPLSQRAMTNLYKVLVGTRPINLAVAIERAPPNTMTNAFELPNGDILFALWTHGQAVDDDPGVRTRLTFPGLSAQQVLAIDVLNGFEQELIIETWTGSLVIRDLFIRDYPLILHITNPSSGSPLVIVLISGLLIGIPIIGLSVYFIRRRRIR